MVFQIVVTRVVREAIDGRGSLLEGVVYPVVHVALVSAVKKLASMPTPIQKKTLVANLNELEMAILALPDGSLKDDLMVLLDEEINPFLGP
jgi:hypothetical protein